MRTIGQSVDDEDAGIVPHVPLWDEIDLLRVCTPSRGRRPVTVHFDAVLELRDRDYGISECGQAYQPDTYVALTHEAEVIRFAEICSEDRTLSRCYYVGAR